MITIIIMISRPSWQESPSNCIAVHCKGGKGRTGVVVAAYLNYSRLFHRADDAMFQFAAKRFSADADPELTGITQPSQRRYVAYFAQVLARELDIRPRPVRLDRLRVTADGIAYTCLFAAPGSGLDLRPWLAPGTADGALRDVLARHWRGRSDRWSEERQAAWASGAPAPAPHAEMAYLGG
jgi:hypothetical protein